MLGKVNRILRQKGRSIILRAMNGVGLARLEEAIAFDTKLKKMMTIVINTTNVFSFLNLIKIRT